ncbi:E3 ubiquitin-protein ligase ZNRF2-like [Orbicella faveolata]|uniref:E3 ubiquitin-protein ligase ZNRF2-like n=1 Tax=Orbicella faveolata TaxID=48498 RepID=UPI0009E22E9C|nr:E3 ubiquitin-protein ligase ZNRF2-like [Orbicella faveolata]
MGAKQSSHNGRANARNVGNGAAVAAAGLPEGSRVVALDSRIRTRSLNNVGQSLSIPGHSASFQESDLSSSPEDNSPSPRGLAMQGAHSLPSHLFATYTTFLNGVKCPVCSKVVLADDIELHLVICLTKPRISYNEDVLKQDNGECVICLEDLCIGDKIARLPCLCIYHKSCIDNWFQVNRSCPEHPTN